MNRAVWQATVAVLCTVASCFAASAQQDRTRQQLPSLSNAFPLSQVLVDTENIVAYEAATKRLYHLVIDKGSVSVKRQIPMKPPELPSESYLPPGFEPRLSVWDLSAEKDGAGNIVVSWRNSSSGLESIRLLYIRPDGTLEHRVVKEFPRQEPFFALRAFPLDPGSVQFFYTYYSEKRFSPILDAGSIEKIWTLRWRNGQVEFDVQLSEQGREHATRYDALHRGGGVFDIAWNEQRIGSLAGPGRKLKIGVVTGAGKPQLKESGSVAAEKLDARKDLVTPIVVKKDGNNVEILAEVPYGDRGKVYKRIDDRGNVLGEFKIEGDVSEFGYDSTTKLFRYVKGPLLGFYRAPKTIKAEVHWTNFAGREWVQQLDVPGDAIFLIQKPGDCFYWLQGNEGKLVLHRKCRTDPKPS